jgi:hypothetical protein
MAWTADWANMGEDLGELHRDVGLYIDDVFEACLERLLVAGGIGFSEPPLWPIQNFAIPTVDNWESDPLVRSNTNRTFSVESAFPPPDESIFTNQRRCAWIAFAMDRLLYQGGGGSPWLDYTGGNFDGIVVPPGALPVFDEAAILADIGDAVRWKFPRQDLVTPSNGELWRWGQTLDPGAPPDADTDWPGIRVWLKQQYEILNRMIWTNKAVDWIFGPYTEKKGTYSSVISQADADTNAAANWLAAAIGPGPGGIGAPPPRARHQSRKLNSAGTTFISELLTHVCTPHTPFAGQGDLVSALVDLYIGTQTSGINNNSSFPDQSFTYDDNGVTDIPLAPFTAKLVEVDVVKAVSSGNLFYNAYGDHTIQPNLAPNPAVNLETFQGYETRGSTGGSGSGSFAVAKWDFVKKL